MRFGFLLFLIFITSCQQNQTETTNPIKESTTDTPVEEIFSSKIVYTENVGWGYQIFDGSKMIILQEHIPAVQGMIGFATEHDAKKTAEYIIHKLENGIQPPTISVEEMDSLGVLPEKIGQ